MGDIRYKTNFEFVWIQLMITQVKNELADALEAETGGAQNLFHGIAEKLIRMAAVNSLFEGQHPEFRTRLTAKKLRVREQVIGR